MVGNQSQGALNDRLLDLESYLIKLGMQYLKEVSITNKAKTRSLILAFRKCFEGIDAIMAE